MCKFFLSQSFLVIACTALSIWTGTANADSALRSAYIGPSVWSETSSAKEVNGHLKAHFAEVINRLEAKAASGLLTALIRAEATSAKRWSTADRRAALVHLARNRQQQIKRLRDYMNRGTFPLNEGQSSKAVPIFVDRHNTHCAVGHLMHLDGKDSEVSKIVRTNNLVRINRVHGGCIVQWIRSSGLTQEEAAMIQPGYPISLDATFFTLPRTQPVVQRNGFTLSDFTYTNALFDTTLPGGFENIANFIDPIFQQGINELDNSPPNPDSPFSTTTVDTSGVLFGKAGGSVGPFFNGPSNLDDWLYIGGNSTNTPTGFVGDIFRGGSPNSEIVEIEYRVQSDLGNFSQVAFNLSGVEQAVGFRSLEDPSEELAVSVLSQIYSGTSNQLLGEASFFAGRSNAGSFAPLDFNSTIETFALNENSLRFKTTALVVGDVQISSFFNEFEVIAVPEPTCGAVVALLFGTACVCRRKRQPSAN